MSSNNVELALERWAKEFNEKYEKEEQRIIALNNSGHDLSLLHATRIIVASEQYTMPPKELAYWNGWIMHEERRLIELGVKT